MFGSRMTAAGVVFVLAITFQFGGLSLLRPLVSFLTPTLPDGSNAQFVITNMAEPFRSVFAGFTFAGAAIGLGAMIWLRFARRGPYLRVMAVLLGVVVVSGLLAAVGYRYYLAASFAIRSSLAAGLGVIVMHSKSDLYTAAGRVPIIAAGAALLVGAVMCAVRGRASQGEECGDKPASAASHKDDDA